MSKDKCCGNCKHFKNEDAEGWGACKFSRFTKCDAKCIYHSFINNGWTEITPDNVDSIYDEVIKRVIVTDGNEYKPVLDWHFGLSTMAKCGGYYYYILPELKIE